MLDVRVCSSCLRKRSDGFSRVSEAIWDACLCYLQEHKHGFVERHEGTVFAYADTDKQTLLMSSEDGFNVEDQLLQEVILAGFNSKSFK